MSRDDGIVVKKYNDKEFRVYTYCASVNYDETEDMTLVNTFVDLGVALVCGTEQQTEYGISYIDGTRIEEKTQNTIVIYFNDGHQEVKSDVDTVRMGIHVGSDGFNDDDYIIIRLDGEAVLKEEKK